MPVAVWASGVINSITGMQAKGFSSQALQQGGIGLLVTVLIISVPPMTARFFGDTAGSLKKSDSGCAVMTTGQIGGFIAVGGVQIEMLFVAAKARGQGMGKALLAYAIDNLDATRVDVNEQNAQVVDRYQHAGFQVSGRSPLDGASKAFPLLHMSFAP